MSLLSGGLQSIFGAAFGSVYRDGTLRKTTQAPNGLGGYSTTYEDAPCKFMADVDSNEARAAMGIPLDGGKFIVLLAGLDAPPSYDDVLIAEATGNLPAISERVVKMQSDPASAAIVVWTVPAP